MHIFHDFSNDLEETAEGERKKVAFNTDSSLPNVYEQDGLTWPESSLLAMLYCFQVLSIFRLYLISDQFAIQAEVQFFFPLALSANP